MRRYVYVILYGAVVIAALGGGIYFSARQKAENGLAPHVQKLSSPPSQKLSTEEIATVSAIIDGDTILLADKRKVRYIGIDTPETKHPIKGVQCYGKEAAQKNKELVEGKTVVLKKDVSETDRYGRLLRYVWTGNIFVNEYLVRNGYAQQSTFPPDVRYATLFKQAADEARKNNRGLWKACR